MYPENCRGKINAADWEEKTEGNPTKKCLVCDELQEESAHSKSMSTIQPQGEMVNFRVSVFKENEWPMRNKKLRASNN